ncbi:dynamin family protein [Streptomyces sp. bgisy034]|uniref:dynamin family protein n=1 Tax=Streptomyces sp. bgisy034 TaxID=3413774 RepID=UPI003EB90491
MVEGDTMAPDANAIEALAQRLTGIGIRGAGTGALAPNDPRSVALADAAWDLCDRIASDERTAALWDAAFRERRRLAEPLRIAVVGAVNGGKSTLVNALLGRPVAPMSGAECTRLSWWFRPTDETERVRVLREGGGEDFLRIGEDVEQGGPIAAERGDPVTVWLRAAADHLGTRILREITLIDTPGLFSLREDRSQHTEELLRSASRRSQRATAEADAVIYCSSEVPGAERDTDVVQSFRSAFGPTSRPPTESLFAYTRADYRWHTRTGALSPLSQADRELKRHADELRHIAWTTAPMVALLAMTARCGGMNSSMMETVEAIAAHPSRRAVLRSKDTPRRELTGLAPGRADEAVARLGLWGLGLAAAGMDAGLRSSPELESLLWYASGVPRLLEAIDTTFRRRADLLRADHALSRLEHAAHTAEGHAGALALTAVAEIRGSDAGTALRDLADLRAVLDPAANYPPDDVAELATLFSGNAPQRDPEAAAKRWARRAARPGATPAQRRLAAHAVRAYRRHLVSTTVA